MNEVSNSLKRIIDGLKHGSLNLVYSSQPLLSNLAIQMCQKEQLEAEEVSNLGLLLSICNILYNNTDKQLLPIEDGVYDILLEKYRKYNPQVEVGAPPITFQNEQQSAQFHDKSTVVITEDDAPDLFFQNDLLVDPSLYMNLQDCIASPVDDRSCPGKVSKRYQNTKHEHPELVGTLDKCKFVLNNDAIMRGVYQDSAVKVVERDFFQSHIQKGIITPDQRFDIILELKYDGISVEADCTDEVVSARTRGDVASDKAADLTPILQGYKFFHRAHNAPMEGVKFEAIITKQDLARFNIAKGYEYRNCRSAIVGLLSSSDAWKYRDFITLVPLAVEEKVFREKCNSDRLMEIEYLNNQFVRKCCPLRFTIANGSYVENLVWIDKFTKEAESIRDILPFMYDGIVVSYRDPQIREKLGRENFVNKYSIAVKFNPLKKESIFCGYTYHIGQDGSITPIINYQPIEFFGTIHTKSSGHSFSKFNELQLRLGDVISIDYVNDVISYVTKPDCQMNRMNQNPIEPFPTRCPVCHFPIEFSDTMKSAKCSNLQCPERQVSRMVNMFQKLGLNGFGEMTIRQMGTLHLYEVIELMTHEHWIERLRLKGFGDVESQNLREQVRLLLQTPLSEDRFLGSLGFTNVSVKTWQRVLSEINVDNRLKWLFNISDYRSKVTVDLSGIIGYKAWETISNELELFKNDVMTMIALGNIVPFKAQTGKLIKVSGFRDKHLVEALEERGYVVDEGSVTKNTVALLIPNDSAVSTKVSKARALGIKIVPIMGKSLEQLIQDIEQ